MKKLLIATMAAVSVGLYAKADTGISFDDANYEVDANLFNVSDQTGKYIVTSGWTTDATSDELFKIIEVDYPEEAVVRHADLSENEKALFIDTSVPLLRNAQEMSNDDYSYPAQDVTTPVFFDSVVQFTATDVAPTATAGKDKLVVWLYATPEDGEKSLGETAPVTNLVVTAGDWSTGSLIPTNYLTNVGIEPNSWHRLTIKSFEKDDLIKFNVWVDGIPVEISGIEAFDSLVEDGALNYNKLQGVAFDGKGAVDDIVFTTTAPEFAQGGEPPVNTFAITCNYEGVSFSSEENGDGPLVPSAIPVGTSTVYAYVAPSEGYVVTAATFNGEVLTVPSFDGAGYNFLLPIGTPKGGDTFNFVVTVELADTPDEPGTDPDPVTPTVNPTSGTLSAVVAGDANAEADAIAAQVTISISDADTAAGVTAAYFKKSAVYDQANSQWVVTVALDETVVQPSADEALEDVAAALTGDETTVSITYAGDDIKPGLYYGLAVAGDLTALETAVPASFARATKDDGVVLSANKPEGNAGFFKVVISATNPNPVQQ